MHTTAVLLHLAHTRSLDDFTTGLKLLNTKFDLYVNLVEGLNSSAELAKQKSQILHHHPKAQIISSPNRGMDVGGMFQLFELVRSKHYQSLLYAHSKSDQQWRNNMLGNLCVLTAQKIEALHSTNSRLGMVGSYFYPFDYYNLTPFVELADMLGVKFTTSWQAVSDTYPTASMLDVVDRAIWAKDNNIVCGRPELDLEYAAAVWGKQASNVQLMNQTYVRQFINHGVLGPLPYFPGNCFWLRAEILNLLTEKFDFLEEFERLPLNLKNDQERQSRAHAWERMLPAFIAKNDFSLQALQS
ncbi:MAG: lipopolysaccharide biosynthesis protein [Arenicella sp.]|jgi:lipopolysaccharide biosynthesis protein